jgi:hypothetical protein
MSSYDRHIYGRHLWWNAGYFGCIFKVRSVLPKPEVGLALSYTTHILMEITFQTNKARLTNDLIAGTIGGFVGTALNTPYVFKLSGACQLNNLALQFRCNADR